jgi:hypothetical protein
VVEAAVDVAAVVAPAKMPVHAQHSSTTDPPSFYLSPSPSPSDSLSHARALSCPHEQTHPPPTHAHTRTHALNSNIAGPQIRGRRRARSRPSSVH